MAFDPFWMFRPSLLRDMNQNINPSWFSPSLNVNLAGNAAVEEKVVTEVASYGRQIGWLNELIVAIVEGKPIPQKTLAQLQQAISDIEAIKAANEKSAVYTAEEALDRLQREHHAGYEILLRSRKLSSD